MQPLEQTALYGLGVPVVKVRWDMATPPATHPQYRSAHLLLGLTCRGVCTAPTPLKLTERSGLGAGTTTAK